MSKAFKFKRRRRRGRRLVEYDRSNPYLTAWLAILKLLSFLWTTISSFFTSLIPRTQSTRPHSFGDMSILDLHDIALLLNYERASTEPRFRGAKLREIANNRTNFQTILIQVPEWDTRSLPKVGYVFDKPRNPSNYLPPDTPDNMLPTPVPDNLKSLTPKEIETIFWQARAHDGCFKAVALLQHFFDLCPDDTQIRIRTTNGTEYTTSISHRVILEMPFIQPNLMSLSIVVPEGMTYLQGESYTMIHAVMGFAQNPTDNITTVVDLSAMQFGENGRGMGGKGVVVIESLDEFYDRVEKVAAGAETDMARTSARIRGTPVDRWLKEVARRAMTRWEQRATKPWCGHCGAPAPASRCSKCQNTWYCNKEHQTNAWAFHKKFCGA
ncbi:hypothetical protein ONZ45_g2701 [Pleurotus djamor]|nr:hypothetical protein ONZ45_g2701 [Pleurotus djamor]